MNKQELVAELSVVQAEWFKKISTLHNTEERVKNARAMGVVEGLRIAIQMVNEAKL